ncbi:GspH/FimT family pseudopilin [Microbulbifer magnicolonia]|uniref:GspH/FimT family pseudopilin n=1 Tax=Microbulbifer magnicolonia TaxID=3109744 RepID=UPI002B40DD2E|nr:GspH/FimT family pseudopilin [Microbulbifer sp. GG15]
MNSVRSAAGFTLIELMFAITILGIVMAVGVPSFTTMIQNNRMVTTTNDLNGTLQYARAEAVRRGGNVRVSAIGGDVSNGLRAWVDGNNDGDFDAGEELRVLRIDFGDLALGADVGGTDTANLDFTFNARGASSLGNTLVLGLCDDRDGDYGRRLELLVSGAVRLTRNTACTSEE